MRKKEKIGKNEFFSIWLLLAGFGAITTLVLIMCISSAGKIPDNVGRVLTEEDQEAVVGRNSALAEYVYLSPNADFPREGTITKITIHHMAGDLELEEVGKRFSDRDRRTSANYAIDSSGKVALYVEEANRAWTSSSKENDSQAVTIEVANDEVGGQWHVGDESYEKLIELCTDICRRNGIEELRYTGDESGNLTLHKMFADTECPGPYLESRVEEIVQTVNQKLKQEE